jgi:putative transcriptional regulator
LDLKELRKKKKMTRIEVANELNISYSHLDKLENGIRTPSLELADKISRFYGKSVDKIFFRP